MTHKATSIQHTATFKEAFYEKRFELNSEIV